MFRTSAQYQDTLGRLVGRMKISTGAFALMIRFGGGVPPLPGLDVAALDIDGPTAMGEEGRPVVFWGEVVRVAARAFDMVSLGRVVFFWGGRDEEADGVEVEALRGNGRNVVGVWLVALEGFVKALSLFSLSSVSDVLACFARGASSCSILLFLGANTVGALTVGS